MFTGCILLLALITAPDDIDSIRTERIDEVIVTSNSARQRLQSVQAGAEQLQLKELTTAPQLFGETDIMRSIQLLPGIKAESDASSSFQVRGGTSAQNLVLFDNCPVYNVGHLAGLFSAFNNDALAGATLYKGLLPAQYGDASSAVLDISGRTGDKQQWHGGATIGLLSAKGTIEGPIIKDKLSFLVTARRTYLDAFLKLSKDFKDNTLYFYDINTKIDWTITPRDQLFLTFFTGYDRTALQDMIDIRWRNLTGSLKWLHHFNGGSNAQTTLLYSSYENDNGVERPVGDEFAGRPAEVPKVHRFQFPGAIGEECRKRIVKRIGKDENLRAIRTGRVADPHNRIVAKKIGAIGMDQIWRRTEQAFFSDEDVETSGARNPFRRNLQRITTWIGRFENGEIVGLAQSKGRLHSQGAEKTAR